MATAVKAEDRERMAPAEPSQMALVWKRFRKHKLGLTGAITLILMVLSVIIVPMILPFEYDQQDNASMTIDPVKNTIVKPMWYTSPPTVTTYILDDPATAVNESFTDNPLAGRIHVLGIDGEGRDNFARLFYAGRISLSVGVITTILVVIIGSLVGALAGFYGGWVDTLLMRLVDLMLSIPTLPILLVLSRGLGRSGFMDNIFGPQLGTMATLIMVLAIFGWLTLSRLVRGSILSLRALDFVEATRALGASNRRIIMRHLMPNSFAPIIVAATLAVGDFIVTESALSFLGLGIRPPTPSWGNIMDEARQNGYAQLITTLNPFEEIRGYIIIFPGLMILITVLSINFMGDALRDALDPRLKT
jgi:peptide/nickel transport system permease protein